MTKKRGKLNAPCPSFRGLCLVFAVLVMASLMVGCLQGPSPEQTTPVPGITPAATSEPRLTSQELRLYGDDPLTLDPAISQDVSSWEYLLHIFSGLVGLDDELRVVPDIASKWDVSSDGRTYTFTLRPDVKFHDGKPVRASDFKYSLERAGDPRLKSPVASTYLGDIVGVAEKLAGEATEISGVVIKDEYTLEITIDSPKEYFISKLTYPTAFVLDKANVEASDGWTQRPNGTGPFKLQEWKKDQAIVLERNDLYYGQKPILQRVRFHLGGGLPLTMYENGELDVAEVGTSNIDRVTDPSNPLNQELRVTPMLSTAYLGLNTRVEPFNDVNVRRAMVHALDRDKIASVLFRGTVTKAEGILPPGMPGYDKELKGPGYDLERARQIIKESTYRDVGNLPFITFSVSAGGGGLATSFADIYQQGLQLEMAVEQVDQGFYDDLEAGRYQLFYLGWVADYPDPQNFLDILFHSKSQGNYTGYSNQKVDELLEMARVERDAGKRVARYREAERIIVEDAPVIPLYHSVSYTLVKPHVKGLVLTPMGILSLKSVEVVR